MNDKLSDIIHKILPHIGNEELCGVASSEDACDLDCSECPLYSEDTLKKAIDINTNNKRQK